MLGMTMEKILAEGRYFDSINRIVSFSNHRSMLMLAL
jgi:hypothetical protein